MVEAYRSSLLKAFNKTLADGFFPMVIVDAINDKVRCFILNKNILHSFIKFQIHDYVFKTLSWSSSFIIKSFKLYNKYKSLIIFVENLLHFYFELFVFDLQTKHFDQFWSDAKHKGFEVWQYFLKFYYYLHKFLQGPKILEY